MPTIKISAGTKENLDMLMTRELKTKLRKARDIERNAIYNAIAKRKFGMTYDEMVSHLIRWYTK